MLIICHRLFVVTYNEGFLAKENEDYCKWILQPKNWGGAIELSILSNHYQCEIAAYDIQTKRCDVYGQVRLAELHSEQLHGSLRGQVLHLLVKHPAMLPR